MATVIIIPIAVIAAVSLAAYLLYKFVIYDSMCRMSVDKTLRRYSIKKTQFQIVQEYYENRGEHPSNREIRSRMKYYRQKEPDQFLAMYEAVRDARQKRQG